MKRIKSLLMSVMLVLSMLTTNFAGLYPSGVFAASSVDEVRQAIETAQTKIGDVANLKDAADAASSIANDAINSAKTEKASLLEQLNDYADDLSSAVDENTLENLCNNAYAASQDASGVVESNLSGAQQAFRDAKDAADELYTNRNVYLLNKKIELTGTAQTAADTAKQCHDRAKTALNTAKQKVSDFQLQLDNAEGAFNEAQDSSAAKLTEYKGTIDSVNALITEANNKREAVRTGMQGANDAIGNAIQLFNELDEEDKATLQASINDLEEFALSDYNAIDYYESVIMNVEDISLDLLSEGLAAAINTKSFFIRNLTNTLSDCQQLNSTSEEKLGQIIDFMNDSQDQANIAAETLAEKYSVTVSDDGHGSTTSSPNGNVRRGTSVELRATPQPNYKFKEWSSNDGVAFANASSAITTFLMLDKRVRIMANFEPDISSRKTESTETADSGNKNNDQDPPSSDEADGIEKLRSELANAIATAKRTGKKQTVYWNWGKSLPYDVMKTLRDNPDITLVFSYRYLGQDFKVTIPGSAAIVNPAVQWYGPVYLYSLYGKVKTPGINISVAASGTYTVKSGDSLSAIAKRLKTTVGHLKQVNNIKNADKIKPGMVLTY